ncbi:MAG: SDR family oxidoreductase [Ilumatobacteraceae bacterium]|nr:SDR family oxidoreductase [Ilumatobacteraceae bacterium]NQW60633.1 SDR family oxidoreductase [bacterium]
MTANEKSANNDHAGQVVVITGGASGLGARFAELFAQRGAHIVIGDIAEEAAHKLSASLGGTSIKCDVTQSNDVDALTQHAVSHFGKIDVFINNAGIAPIPNEERFATAVANQMLRLENNVGATTPLNVITDMTDEEWDHMLKVHLYGTFYGCRAAARYMTPQRSGSIINISSVLGLRPTALAPHYSTAKAAIIALTKSQSQELAPLGVRVNAVCPGYIDTPLLAPMNELMKVAIVSQIGIGRLGVDDEIAEMVSFIASAKASYCTGEIFSVTGGYSG